MVKKPSKKSPIKTAGRFDPGDVYIYFIASNVERMKFGSTMHDYLLVAVNELNTETDIEHMASWIESGKHVFLDSGVYALAMRHAEAHGLTHDQALNTPPQEMDNFQPLLEKYTAIVSRFGDRLWGYIELDMGGRENKIKTRSQLEAAGMRPIPVYHPFGDGWDYFDELCSTYDRICFGNIVKADAATRKRLLATAWERKQKYPHVWIHLLGLTPNQWLNAYPINSGDSSSWLSSVRWSGYHERTMLTTLSQMNMEYRYELGSDRSSEIGSRKATAMSAYGAYINQLNWRNHINQLHQLGMEAYPRD